MPFFPQGPATRASGSSSPTRDISTRAGSARNAVSLLSTEPSLPVSGPSPSGSQEPLQLLLLHPPGPLPHGTKHRIVLSILPHCGIPHPWYTERLAHSGPNKELLKEEGVREGWGTQMWSELEMGQHGEKGRRIHRYNTHKWKHPNGVKRGQR